MVKKVIFVTLYSPTIPSLSDSSAIPSTINQVPTIESRGVKYFRRLLFSICAFQVSGITSLCLESG
jgi:hypothetical protein